MKKTIISTIITSVIFLSSCGSITEKRSEENVKPANFTEETKEIENVKREILTVSAIKTDAASYTFTGKDIEPKIKVYTADGTKISSDNYTVSYEDNLNVGTAKITVIGKNDAQGTVTASFEIVPCIPNAKITCKDTVYTGEIAEPEITIKNGDIELTEDDFDIECEDIEAGIASAAITFKGNYKGEAEAVFDIKPAELNDKNTEITVNESNLEYTGHPVSSKVTVTYNGNELGNDSYDVSYKNNIDPGEATVIITGTKNYTGSVEETFNIKPAMVTGLTAKTTTDSVNLSWNESKKADGYRVYQNTSDGWKKITDTTETSYTVKDLKSNTAYEFKVTAFIGEQPAPDSDVLKTATELSAPAKVNAGSASSSETTVTLNWSGVSGATGYQIDRWNGSSYVYAANANYNVKTYTISNLNSYTNYQFRIRAYSVDLNGNVVWGESSDAIKITTQKKKETAPAAPVTTVKADASKNQITTTAAPEAENTNKVAETKSSDTTKADTVKADTSTYLYYFNYNSYAYDKNMNVKFTIYAGNSYTGHYDPAYPKYIAINYYGGIYYVKAGNVSKRANAKMLPTYSIGQMGGSLWGRAACGPTAAAILVNSQMGVNWNKDDLINYSHSHYLVDQGYTGSLLTAGSGMTAPKLVSLINGYSGGKYTAKNVYGTGGNTSVLKKLIDNGQRAIVVVRYTSFGNIVASYNGGTHFVVICGYEYINGELYFYFADPFYGSVGSQYSTTICRVHSNTLSYAMEYSGSREPKCIITVS